MIQVAKCLLIFVWCLMLCGIGRLRASEFKSDPEIIYRGQAKEEAFSFVMYLTKKLPWFNANGYNVSLPQHKMFEKLYQNPALITEKDVDSLRNIFYAEVYDESRFAAILEAIRQTKGILKNALQKLNFLKNNWGFDIKRRYEIVLTLYGPGGNYKGINEVGFVIKKIAPNNFVESTEKYIKTIVHEIVHIGIDEIIVQKYKLKHWEKERLVDLICLLYLKDLVPWYKAQDITDKKIDDFLNERVITENLPMAIENFISQYPRNALV